MAKPDSVAEAYHLLTKYTESSIAQGSGMDWATQPAQHKEIVSQLRVSLRPYLPRKPDAAEEADPEPLGEIGRLSRLLFHTNGLTGLLRYGQERGQFLRAAPSAGALYPTEIYVAARRFGELEPGLYNYQVPTHELILLWEGDPLDEIKSACGDAAPFEDTELCLVFTGVFWRSAWRYQERGYRRVLLDTGHALANLAAYAPHVGYAAHQFYGFVDPVLNGLFFFDDAVEAALACVAIGEGLPEPAPLWASPPREAADIDGATIAAESDLGESATVKLHRASSCWERLPGRRTADGPPAVSGRSIPLEPPVAIDRDLPQTIFLRRSARAYAGGRASLAQLGHALGFALGRDDPAARFATHDAGFLRCHVVALEVDGLDAGIYAVEGAGEALLPLAIGDFRDRLHHLSLGQEIARRCAATVIFSAPASDAVALLGDRAYRYLHLEAGAIGERFQLAAAALDLSACGIGGFFDDEAAELVQCRRDDWVLYLVTIGKEG